MSAEEEIPADHQYPTAGMAADQQGPAALSPPWTDLTAYTGEAAITPGATDKSGLSPSPPPALSRLLDTDSFRLDDRAGPRCTDHACRCDRCFSEYTARWAEHLQESSRGAWLNSDYTKDHIQPGSKEGITAGANKHRQSYVYEFPASTLENRPNATTSSFSWWRFPAEVRNMIYDLSLHWPNSYALYRGYNKQLSHYYRELARGHRPPFPQFSGRMQAPTILLLSRAIRAECAHVLRARPFVIDQIPPWLPGARRPMSLTRFVGGQTLRGLRHIDVRVALGEGIGSGWVWADVLRELFDALRGGENRFRTLRVMLKCCNTANTSLWRNEERDRYLQIKDMIDRFAEDGANVWNPGQVYVEDWVVQGHRARRAVPRIPGTFYYPNRDIWPGSMLEFVQPFDPVQRRPSIGLYDSSDGEMDANGSGHDDDNMSTY